MKRVVVTGGAGFIGSNFSRHILNTYPDYEVVVVDKFSYTGNPDNIKDLDGPRFSLVEGDICDPLTLQLLEAYAPVDYLVNFAKEDFRDDIIKTDDDFVRSNVLGVLCLLHWVQKHPETRMVQIGTDGVYGDTPLDSRRRFREDSPLCPNNPYAATKAAADLLVHSYCRTYGVKAILTRCSNNYGPYQFPEKFIPRMITNALKDEPLPIYSNGANIRDWIHVTDHCRAIDEVMHNGTVDQTYNICGESARANIDVACAILDLLGKPRSLLEFVPDRPGHDQRYAIESARINIGLGWYPNTTFEAGLKSTVQWYVDNPEWLRRIETGEYQDGS